MDSGFQSNRSATLGWRVGMAMAMLALALVSGCKDRIISPDREALRGESCESTNECSSGLVCVNNKCIDSEFPISPEARVCVYIECSNTQPCNQGEICSAGLCVQACANDGDCAGSALGGVCVDGRCTQCRSTEQCGVGFACRATRCQPICSTNADCNFFHECNGGECRPSGCRSDRECVAYTGFPWATCEEAADGGTPFCHVSCQNNHECNGHSDRNWQFACVNDRCEYVGCASDQECELQRRSAVPVPGRGTGPGGIGGPNPYDDSGRIPELRCASQENARTLQRERNDRGLPADGGLPRVPPSSGGGGGEGGSAFTCFDGDTIPASWVCDGGCDCSECEDEFGCS